MKNLFRIIFALFITNVVVFSGCKKDKISDPALVGKQAFAEGVLIVNEGMFPGIGSVSFYNRTTGQVQNDIFFGVNGVPLGSMVQSLEVYDSLAYIVVNNSGKVEVVNAGTFKSVGTITGLNSPRYFIGIDSIKGYVSNWPNTVAVINLQDLSVTKTIETSSGPDKMILSSEEVFVINGGGWGIDSTITVIDYHNDFVTQTIQVGKRPTGIVKASDGGIWVMCSGKGFNGWPQDGDSEGHLMKINPISHNVEKDISFPGTSNHPEKLTINKDGTILYFLYSQGIYQMNISSSVYNYTMLAEKGGFYNLGYDPFSNIIYASDPGDFQSDGFVYRFNPVDGAKIDSIKVGVGPGGVLFPVATNNLNSLQYFELV